MSPIEDVTCVSTIDDIYLLAAEDSSAAHINPPAGRGVSLGGAVTIGFGRETWNETCLAP